MLLLTMMTMLPTVVRGENGPAFSSLPAENQYAIRAMVEPPPLSHRYGPYSTPNYYLVEEGYDYDGTLDHEPTKRTYKSVQDKVGPDHGSWVVDRNRPDWQEAMLRDWADLGLNNTHLNIYPVKDELDFKSAMKHALLDYLRLSEKYGIKVGVRLDALGGYAAWEMHPNNPDNQIERYLQWVDNVVTLLKGEVIYYVLGDELTLHEPKEGIDPKLWTPDQYLGYFKRVSARIKAIDPDVKVSMFGASSGEWFNVIYLLKHGYGEVGDGVAINHYDYNSFPKFFAEARQLAPHLQFYSNGVGYHSVATSPRYPEGDPYSLHRDEQSHSASVAKTMFITWDLGLATAPYYVTLRNWVIRDRVYPRWFGFFGFQDFVIDEHDNLTVKRYPAWYAFQTVSHTFYNRDEFQKPEFDVSSSAELSMFRPLVHEVEGGRELVIMAWHDGAPQRTTVSIADGRFRYPVRVNLFNRTDWQDVPYRVTDGKVEIDLEVQRQPSIVRLVER